MSVYVDPLMRHGGSTEFRWVKSCHLYADTVDELHRFARSIGLRRAWFQDRPGCPHYDLNERRRVIAVAQGAVETSRRHIVEFIRSRRECSAAPDNQEEER